jgi:hypothetical protein
MACSKKKEMVNGHLFGIYGVAIDGYFFGDSNTVSTIFHEADQVKLYNDKDYINGVSCYVLEAVSKYGKHKIWIDPEHGYNICQAEVVKNKNDLFDGEPVSTPPPEYITKIQIALSEEGQPPIPTKAKTEVILTMNNVKFQEYDGVWVPVSGDWESKVTYEDGRILTVRINYKKFDIDLSPDFEAAKAFEPNIPNGTSVRMDGENPAIPLYWQNGKVAK